MSFMDNSNNSMFGHNSNNSSFGHNSSNSPISHSIIHESKNEIDLPQLTKLSIENESFSSTTSFTLSSIFLFFIHKSIYQNYQNWVL